MSRAELQADLADACARIARLRQDLYAEAPRVAVTKARILARWAKAQERIDEERAAKMAPRPVVAKPIPPAVLEMRRKERAS